MGGAEISLWRVDSLLFSKKLFYYCTIHTTHSKSVSIDQHLLSKLPKETTPMHFQLGDALSRSAFAPLGDSQTRFIYFKRKAPETKGSSHKRQIKIGANPGRIQAATALQRLSLQPPKWEPGTSWSQRLLGLRVNLWEGNNCYCKPLCT